MKIVIGIPSGDYWKAEFATSLLAVPTVPVPDAQVAILNRRGPSGMDNRNYLASAALDADYLLLLDADMVVPPHTLRQLLSHGVDVVGCVYRKRAAPHEQIGTVLGDSPDTAAPLIEMERVPSGCLLIRSAVFRAIGFPYFLEGYVDGRHESEDFYFCRKAREAGFQVWCDTRLSTEIGHIGDTVITHRKTAEGEWASLPWKG